MNIRIPKSKQHRLTTLSILTKRLDKVFSEFIRKRDDGQCFTCPVKRELKYMQAGHFVSRGYKPTRWDETNVHCQCVGCNVFKKGNMAVYSEHLILKYGQDHIAYLNKLSLQEYKADRKNLEERIKHYQQLIKQNDH